MPLCQGRSCGCSLISNSLIITGDGSAGSPWQIEGAAPQRMTEAARAALSGGQLFDGLFVWTTDQDILWVYTGSAWKRVGTGWISYTPTLGNWTVGAGGSLLGRYLIVRDLCYVTAIATFNGSAGTYAGNPSISLPFPSVGLLTDQFPDYLNSNIHHAAATIYSAIGRLSGSTAQIWVMASAYPISPATWVQQQVQVDPGTPFTWSSAAAGSQIYIRGWYPIA
jgi:hypothetical protein